MGLARRLFGPGPCRVGWSWEPQVTSRGEKLLGMVRNQQFASPYKGRKTIKRRETPPSTSNGAGRAGEGAKCGSAPRFCSLGDALMVINSSRAPQKAQVVWLQLAPCSSIAARPSGGISKASCEESQPRAAKAGWKSREQKHFRGQQKRFGGHQKHFGGRCRRPRHFTSSARRPDTPAGTRQAPAAARLINISLR